MNNDKDLKWSGKNQPNGRQPDYLNQSGPPDTSPDISEEERLPDEVTGALKELGQRRPAIPDSVRAAIMNDAAGVLKRVRNQPTKPRPGWSRRSWFGISAGVLASAVLVAVMLPSSPRAVNEPAELSRQLTDAGRLPKTSSARSMLSMGQDVDGNGQVNILDAFALARSVEGDETAGRFEMARLDQNGDGVVNAEDVDSLAMLVVML